MTGDNDRSIKLYHYKASPYARKIVWYLTLRELKYAEVMQPVIMPRPGLSALGVAYRRIPVMTIGKDIYCDTRIILRKLEEFWPEERLGARTPEGQALQKMLEVWHVEGPLFFKGVGSMNPKNFSAPAFAKDREQMTGTQWSEEAMQKVRPEALIYMRNYFTFLEKWLADDRAWLLKNDRISMVDVEAVWLAHWVKGGAALPEDLISRSLFPKTYAWIERFDIVVQSSQSVAPKPDKLDGKTAAKQIFESGFAEELAGVSGMDPQKLSAGDQVELFPTDSGMNNKDHGKLLSLTEQEIVIELESGLRLHTPRIGFRVRKAGSKM